MKKIILGCAAVLLSLGLLAGCNNEESDKAVSIKVDTAATVVVGESLTLPYTVEPEKADIEVLNNHEEYVTAVAQEGTLYLEGVAEGSATVTLVGTYKKYTEANVSIAVSVVTKSTADTGPGEEEPGDTGETEPGEQVITLSGVPEKLEMALDDDPETIVPEAEPKEAKIEYEITDVVFTTEPDPADEDACVISVEESEDGYVVTPGAEGTANIVFTASLDGYDAVSATTAVTVHEEGWTAPTEVSGLVLSIELTCDEVTPYTLPEWLDIYVLGEWTCEELDSLDTATKLEYDEGTQTYVTTISEELEIEGWYNYDLFAVYNTGITQNTVSWDHKINGDHEYFQVPEYSVEGDVISKTYALPDEFESEYPDPDAEGTVQQKTNHTINFFFVDNESEPNEYYEIPSYADGYLTGYFTSDWTDYSIDGDTKLVANDSSDVSKGYSVTIDTIYTGERTVNIYFEFNGSGTHSAATEANWDASHSIFGSGNGTITIDNTADVNYSNVYLAYNPSEIIVDDAAQTSVTLAIKDTNNTGETPLYCSGTMNSWNNSNTMTYNASGADYQYSYTFDVDEGSQLEFGIFNSSSWGDSLQVPTGAPTGFSNSGNNIVIASSVITGDKVLILFTADCTNFGTSTHVTATSVTVTYAS